MYQIFIYSILAAAKITLVAISFAIVFLTTRFFHFAHGIVFTAGAYFTFLFKAWFGLPPFFQFFSPSLCPRS
jgi:branched-chain amino acid transport system permease protein